MWPLDPPAPKDATYMQYLRCIPPKHLLDVLFVRSPKDQYAGQFDQKGAKKVTIHVGRLYRPEIHIIMASLFLEFEEMCLCVYDLGFIRNFLRAGIYRRAYPFIQTIVGFVVEE